MRKLIQKILKCKIVSVTTIYADPLLGVEWICFGKFTICKYYK